MSDDLDTRVQGPELDEHWTEELDELPPRPRRKLLTPVTGALLAILIAAGGFIGGVLVEKGHSGGSGGGSGLAALAARARAGQAGSGSGAAARRAGRNGFGALFGGGGSGRGGGRGNLTVGQVSSVEGRTLYVSTAQGGTVRVKVPAGESVSRTTTTSVHAIHPGDSVIVQGARGRGGAIKATSVRATKSPSGSGSSGGSTGAILNQLFGGGGGGSAGGASAGPPPGLFGGGGGG